MTEYSFEMKLYIYIYIYIINESRRYQNVRADSNIHSINIYGVYMCVCVCVCVVCVFVCVCVRVFLCLGNVDIVSRELGNRLYTANSILYIYIYISYSLNQNIVLQNIFRQKVNQILEFFLEVSFFRLILLPTINA